MLPSLKVTCQSLVEKLIYSRLRLPCCIMSEYYCSEGYLVSNSMTKNRTFNWRDSRDNHCRSRCSGGTWSGNFLLHEETMDAPPETSKRSGTVDGLGSSSYLRKNAR